MCRISQLLYLFWIFFYLLNDLWICSKWASILRIFVRILRLFVNICPRPVDELSQPLHLVWIRHWVAHLPHPETQANLNLNHQFFSFLLSSPPRFPPSSLSFPTPRSRIQGGVVQMREVWRAHAPHASFPPKLPPGCCLLTHITSSSLRQKQQQQPPY